MNELSNFGKFSSRKEESLAKWSKIALVVLFLLVLSVDDVSAQSQTITRMETVKTWVNSLVNTVFIIAILYAAVMAVIKFIRSDQGAWGYAFSVLIALMFWGGFNTYKEDIFTMMGGQNGITVEAGAGAGGGE